MPQIGPLEILIVGVLALIVLGPEKLPHIARSAAKGLGQLKRMASEVKSEFDLNLRDEQEDKPARQTSASDGAALPDADADPASSRPPATV